MAHRDDHAAALARAAALQRDLERARRRAERAEQRATDAERRATNAEERAAAAVARMPREVEMPTPMPTPTPAPGPVPRPPPPMPAAPTIETPEVAGDGERPPDGDILLPVLLILASSCGAVVVWMWLMQTGR